MSRHFKHSSKNFKIIINFKRMFWQRNLSNCVSTKISTEFKCELKNKGERNPIIVYIPYIFLKGILTDCVRKLRVCDSR